ncbi:unnamed protein product [Amoebophrya sp. A120]|nr:unnamed protein product [Amoebophrya sp. A120]|eukprot:GSA120T00006076001.1
MSGSGSVAGSRQRGTQWQQEPAVQSTSWSRRRPSRFSALVASRLFFPSHLHSFHGILLSRVLLSVASTSPVGNFEDIKTSAADGEEDPRISQTAPLQLHGHLTATKQEECSSTAPENGGENEFFSPEQEQPGRNEKHAEDRLEVEPVVLLEVNEDSKSGRNAVASPLSFVQERKNTHSTSTKKEKKLETREAEAQVQAVDQEQGQQVHQQFRVQQEMQSKLGSARRASAKNRQSAARPRGKRNTQGTFSSPTEKAGYDMDAYHGFRFSNPLSGAMQASAVGTGDPNWMYGAVGIDALCGLANAGIAALEQSQYMLEEYRRRKLTPWSDDVVKVRTKAEDRALLRAKTGGYDIAGESAFTEQMRETQKLCEEAWGDVVRERNEPNWDCRGVENGPRGTTEQERAHPRPRHGASPSECAKEEALLQKAKQRTKELTDLLEKAKAGKLDKRVWEQEVKPRWEKAWKGAWKQNSKLQAAYNAGKADYGWNWATDSFYKDADGKTNGSGGYKWDGSASSSSAAATGAGGDWSWSNWYWDENLQHWAYWYDENSWYKWDDNLQKWLYWDTTTGQYEVWQDQWDWSEWAGGQGTTLAAKKSSFLQTETSTPSRSAYPHGEQIRVLVSHGEQESTVWSTWFPFVHLTERTSTTAGTLSRLLYRTPTGLVLTMLLLLALFLFAASVLLAFTSSSSPGIGKGNGHAKEKNRDTTQDGGTRMEVSDTPGVDDVTAAGRTLKGEAQKQEQQPQAVAEAESSQTFSFFA